MSYDDDRNAAHLAYLEKALESFKKHDGQKLIILFPGGIGSQLVRAGQPSTADDYYRSWFDPLRIFGGGEIENLQIEEDGRDFGGNYVIPDAEIELALGPPDEFQLPALSFYAGFKDWCDLNNLNLLIYGWDWRRGVRHSADFFLDKAVPILKGKDILLDGCVLLGHSAGGMVVKVIANRADNDFVQKIDKAITVATPFYGHGAQIHKFIAGMPGLNVIMGGAQMVARTCSSMLGGYEFMYMDEETYNLNANDFRADRERYQLFGYPSLDPDGSLADPFNPRDSRNEFRFAPAGGFRKDLMEEALLGVRMVAQDLKPAIASKFYCIRGIQYQNGDVLTQTPISIKWRRVPQAYDCDTFATSPDYPIDETLGAGDGFLAAWGTRLLRLPKDNVIDVRDDLEHELILNKPSVQREIGLLLGIAENKIDYPGEFTPLLAAWEEVERYFDGLYKSLAGMDESGRRSALRAHVSTPDYGVFNRTLINLSKSPKQLARLYPSASKTGTIGDRPSTEKLGSPGMTQVDPPQPKVRPAEQDSGTGDYGSRKGKGHSTLGRIIDVNRAMWRVQLQFDAELLRVAADVLDAVSRPAGEKPDHNRSAGGAGGSPAAEKDKDKDDDDADSLSFRQARRELDRGLTRIEERFDKVLDVLSRR